MQKLISDIEYSASYINSLMLCRINDHRKILVDLTERGVLKSPERLFSDRKLVIDALLNALKLRFNEIISKNKEKFLLSVGKLDALSPLKLMSSGYCVALDRKNKVINRVAQVKKNDEICIVVSDGKFDCEVKNMTAGGVFLWRKVNLLRRN